MPDGWKFGRVSAVAVNAKGEVYVFHRGAKADPIVVFDGKGKFLARVRQGDAATSRDAVRRAGKSLGHG